MGKILIWDVQTGVIIASLHPRRFGELVFSGDCRTVTLLSECGTWSTYDVFDICDWFGAFPKHESRLAPSTNFLQGAHQVHGESLWISTCSKNAGDQMINIQELQPSSYPPLSLIKSFPVPLYDGEISFSPVSFHISFVTKMEVFILDVQDLRVLLQAKAVHSYYTPPGHFSPDGSFFACGTEEYDICTWKNTYVNYIPWGSLQPRLSFGGFSFSPTTPSVLTWGQGGIQLLELGNYPTIHSPRKPKSHWEGRNHLVAYSTDGTHIVTAWHKSSVIVVLGTLSNTPPQSFNTNMEILDIKIVGSTIFVADGHRLVGWHSETGEPVHNSETVAITTSTPHPYLTLSIDCLQIAFIGKGEPSSDNDTVFLYDVQAQGILCSYTMQSPVEDIRFSPDGHQLWFIASPDDKSYHNSSPPLDYNDISTLCESYCDSATYGSSAAFDIFSLPDYNVGHHRLPTSEIITLEDNNSFIDSSSLDNNPLDNNPLWLVKLERAGDGSVVCVAWEYLSDRHDTRQVWVDHFSNGRHVRGRSEWVVDSRGKKLLWLPLSWRVKSSQDVRWDRNHLAFVSGDHPAPIIVVFQP